MPLPIDSQSMAVRRGVSLPSGGVATELAQELSRDLFVVCVLRVGVTLGVEGTR
jgi:hypothetical protein